MATNQVSSSSSSSSPSSSSLAIPQTAPAGGITITQPPQTATSFFKIAPSETITFGWNFTSVLATPTSLTVSAVAGNGNTYAVGPNNGIIPGTATQVIWDIFSYQQNHANTPLAAATYTLHIWDDRGPNPLIQPGFMQPNNGLQFALYTPQAYTALANGWTCPSCNSAVSYASHPAFIGLIASIMVMFLSGMHLFRAR